jgi:hypothetical protein
MQWGPSEIGVTAGLCFAAFLVFVIVGVVRTNRKERARQEALRQWAAHNGFQYLRRPADDWGRRMPGRNRRGVTVALSGPPGGRPVTIAEYFYTHTTSSRNSSTGRSSDTTHTYHFVLTVARLRRPAPPIAVHRRGAVSRFGRQLFGDKATAIGYEPFDRDYRVVAPDPRQVRGLLSGALVAEHVAGRLPDWSVEGDEVLTFREGRIGDPGTILAELAPVARVADLIDARP